MTRQKFYEMCVKKTMERASCDDGSPFFKDLETVGDVDKMSFKQLVMKWNLFSKTRIPEREDFRGWGVGYLCQLLGFVANARDDEFTTKFFEFLGRNRSLYKKAHDKKVFGNMCYYAFVDNLTTQRDFCVRLTSFMIFNFVGEEWFGKFLKLAYNFVLLDISAMDEYYRLTRGETPAEIIRKILFDGDKEEDNGGSR